MPSSNFRAAAAVAVLGAAMLASPIAARADAATPVGAVYTMSNAPGGNAVIVYDRLDTGELVPAGSFSTGGVGTGGGLGNQSAVTLSSEQEFLLVVNPGSDDISVFRVREDGLTLVDRVDSGGSQPVSIAENSGRVFVLNAGSDSIFGFFMAGGGKLTPRPNSRRPLSSTGSGPAQIGFSPDGDVLVVTEKATNRITTFRLSPFGLANERKVFPASGTTPFGFAFGERRQLIVSEAAGGAAGASSASSYRVARNGTVTPLSEAVPTTQTAACWVTLTPDGRFAFTTNTGSGTISAYSVGFGGGLELEDAVAGTIGGGSAPIDMAISPDGRHLYALSGNVGTISVFDAGAAGALTAIQTVSGLPVGVNGLAAR
jgi:6-phosphogluconolactonase